MSSSFCTAAQLPLGGDSTPVPELPAPPALVHYTVENPWPVVVALSIGVLILLWMMMTGRTKGKRWTRVGTAAMAASALAVGISASLIKTDRETLGDRTDELISVTAAADTSGLQSLLAPEVSFRLLGGENRFSRDQIVELVKKYPGKEFPIDGHKVDQHQAAMDGTDLGRTQVHVRVRIKEEISVPVGSWWRINWKRSGDTWKVTGMECLQIDGVSPGRDIRP